MAVSPGQNSRVGGARLADVVDVSERHGTAANDRYPHRAQAEGRSIKTGRLRHLLARSRPLGEMSVPSARSRNDSSTYRFFDEQQLRSRPQKVLSGGSINLVDALSNPAEGKSQASRPDPDDDDRPNTQKQARLTSLRRALSRMSLSIRNKPHVTLAHCNEDRVVDKEVAEDGSVRYKAGKRQLLKTVLFRKSLQNISQNNLADEPKDGRMIKDANKKTLDTKSVCAVKSYCSLLLHSAKASFIQISGDRQDSGNLGFPYRSSPDMATPDDISLPKLDLGHRDLQLGIREGLVEKAALLPHPAERRIMREMLVGLRKDGEIDARWNRRMSQPAVPQPQDHVLDLVQKGGARFTLSSGRKIWLALADGISRVNLAGMHEKSEQQQDQRRPDEPPTDNDPDFGKRDQQRAAHADENDVVDENDGDDRR